MDERLAEAERQAQREQEQGRERAAEAGSSDGDDGSDEQEEEDEEDEQEEQQPRRRKAARADEDSSRSRSDGFRKGDVVDVESEDGWERHAKIIGPSKSRRPDEMRVRFADGVVDDWPLADFRRP